MRINKKACAIFVSLFIAVGALVALNVTGTTTEALGTTSTRRDCTDEDIIYCGALTQTELLQKYDKNEGDVQAIYSHFGVNRSDLAGTTSEVKMGTLKTDGTVVVDGKTVATNAYSIYRIRTKDNAETFTVNGKTYYKLPVNGVYWKDADVFVLFKDGQFFQAVQTSCGNIITATPEKPEVKPVYSCDSLTANKIDRTKFEFNATATAKNGARIAHYVYDFGDGHTKTTNDTTVEHEYAKPGRYTVTVTVNVKVNDGRDDVTSARCKVSVKVEAVPVTPLYVCNSLTAQIVDTKARTYAYTLDYTAEGGATLQKVVYDFGDNTSATYEAAKASHAEHTYAQEGSYKTTATLYFNVNNGTETTEETKTCEVAINISKEMCTVPGKENFPKNSPECVETPPTTPPALPQTGITDLLSGGLGLGSLTAAGYYWVSSRKDLLTALLKR